MINSRAPLAVLLYFYQGDLTQEDADAVLEAFKDKDVQFRKVHDVNDTRDMLEKCAHAAGTIPLIYFIRTAEGVLTKGVLADPLGRPNASKSVAVSEEDAPVQKSTVVVGTGQPQPTDANIAAKLLKEEVEQATQKTAEPLLGEAEVKAKVDAAVKAADDAAKGAPTVAAPAKPTSPTKPAAPVVPSANK